jgi:UDP-N-acetylglucosamine 1-carboxyvinyltransferase
MNQILIRGGNRLQGSIPISGAKNAALPLLAAGLLTNERIVLSNIPQLADIKTMSALLTHHGVTVHPQTEDGNTLSVGGVITCTEAPYDIVRKMRASILVLGPLLARCGEARVSLPGGCAIGARPIDIHLKGLTQMGADINLEGGYIQARAPKGLMGANILLDMPSVGATENLVMAASLAYGRTTIRNVAREPEIVDLILCLRAMGARIEGEGTNHLTIDGVSRLHGATHSVIADRIEVGTYACAAAITNGDLLLCGARIEHQHAVVNVLRTMGVDVIEEKDGIRVRGTGCLRSMDIRTDPYPGFPTDMQAQLMALMSVANGVSQITETIFENRFIHVPELNRLGARITVQAASARLYGVPKLLGASVMATDLRASVSLVLAGLAAQGETCVNRVYHLDRGYERLEAKLMACGADIERVI